MVERVAFAIFEVEMDEFYLSEEIIEWIGQKKSEYLSVLINNSLPDDFEFHEYMSFEELIPMTLSLPDWSTDAISEGHKIKTFVRTFHQGFTFQQVVIGVLIPDQEKNDVFIPILAFVSKKPQIVQLFTKGPGGQRH